MWAALGRGAAGLRVFGSHPAIPGFLLLVRVRYNLIPNLYLYKQLLYIGALRVEACVLCAVFCVLCSVFCCLQPEVWNAAPTVYHSRHSSKKDSTSTTGAAPRSF